MDDIKCCAVRNPHKTVKIAQNLIFWLSAFVVCAGTVVAVGHSWLTWQKETKYQHEPKTNKLINQHQHLHNEGNMAMHHTGHILSCRSNK